MENSKGSRNMRPLSAVKTHYSIKPRGLASRNQLQSSKDEDRPKQLKDPLHQPDFNNAINKWEFLKDKEFYNSMIAKNPGMKKEIDAVFAKYDSSKQKRVKTSRPKFRRSTERRRNLQERSLMASGDSRKKKGSNRACVSSNFNKIKATSSKEHKQISKGGKKSQRPYKIPNERLYKNTGSTSEKSVRLTSSETMNKEVAEQA